MFNIIFDALLKGAKDKVETFFTWVNKLFVDEKLLSELSRLKEDCGNPFGERQITTNYDHYRGATVWQDGKKITISSSEKEEQKFRRRVDGKSQLKSNGATVFQWGNESYTKKKELTDLSETPHNYGITNPYFYDFKA